MVAQVRCTVLVRGTKKNCDKLRKEMEFEKEYITVIKGKPEEDEGVFKDLLFKDSQKNKTFVV